MGAYYNEHEPFAAEWLRGLERGGKIASGRVDDRDVRTLSPSDVLGHEQAHFFAGIGGWSLALRLAGWPDDRSVWTGSCPCQPFSQAGARRGVGDDRHLWPDWFKLIAQCRPSVVFGEQVSSPDGLAWLDSVRADLEGAGYAFGAADLCAAGVGAPHLRQRLWFVGVADGASDGRREGRNPSGRDRTGPVDDGAIDMADPERERGGARRVGGARGRSEVEPDRRGEVGDRAAGVSLADAYEAGRGVERGRGLRDERDTPRGDDAHGRGSRVVGDARLDRDREHARELHRDEGEHAQRCARGDHAPEHAGADLDPWSRCEWIPCRDPRHGVVYRPAQPGSFPLAHGVPGRVGLLRGYGNAIVPQAAAVFVQAVMEWLRR